MQMRKKALIVLFGLVVYAAWNIGLFGAALVFGFEDVAPPPTRDMMVGTLVASVVAGVVSWLGSKLLRLAGRRERLIEGTVWSGMVIALLLIVTIANKTTGTIFGQWGAYVSFAAIFIGAMLGVRSSSSATTGAPPTPTVPPAAPPHPGNQ